MDLLEEFNKRHDPKDRILRCVDAWLASHPTLRGLEIAATCIQHIGNRKDLSLLDKYKIEGPVEEITMVKTNARFSVYRRTLD